MFDQSTRPIRIETSGEILKPNEILIESFEYREAMSAPYELQCSVLVPNLAKNLDDMISTPIRVSLETQVNGWRFLHAFVRSIELVESEHEFARYAVTAVPYLWFLSLRRNCRIFQDQPVPDILKAIFDEYGAGIRIEWKIQPDYPRRRYCVQYLESDFDFVSRLLEEEGIYYFFRHTKDEAVMVLADLANATKPCRDEAVPFDIRDEGAALPCTIKSARRQMIAQSKVFAFTDYNFKDPSDPLFVKVHGKDTGAEQFHYPGKYQKEKEGERYAKIRLQEEECQKEVLKGTSDCRELTSGFRFTMRRHFNPSLDGEYLLTSIVHKATCAYYRSTQKEETFHFTNEWKAIPSATLFRPAKVTPKPKVQGSQTAVVTGVEMDKPHTDKFGRVRVHFFWDRYGKRDGKDTCWIRVSQPWAGRNWGAVSIPRVGQEVIVDFLEGDPDRPIVTGRVYNAEMTHPYELPEGAKNMGLKSRSIGGSGYNEVSVNDTNESEGITIHAQKDMSTVVVNNETVDIGNCRTEKVGINEDITIGQNRTESVGLNESIKVGVDRSMEVGANESYRITADRTVNIGGNETASTAGNRNTTIGASEIHTVSLTRTRSVGINEMVNVGAAQQLTVGGIRIVTVGVAQMVNVGMKHSVNAGTSIALNAPQITLEASESLTLSCGGGTITIDAGGTITINGPLVKINC